MATATSRPAIAPLRQVAHRRILFGHQSVGGNVLAGVRRLAAEEPGAGLRIVATDRPPDGRAIAGVLIGENGKPESKISHFDDLMASAMGDWAEVAFFKFCYADFEAETDVEKLFHAYERAHVARRRRYPRTIFVHVTTPLTTVQRGPRGWLKDLTGAAPWGVRENVKRNQYNELLRRGYEGNEPVFDLARLEAAGALGSFTRAGRGYECLAAVYTDDGGHLNPIGAAAVAEPLLQFLAALPAGAR